MILSSGRGARAGGKKRRAPRGAAPGGFARERRCSMSINYDVANDWNTILYFGIWVMAVWLAGWIFVVAISEYARWRASHGDEWWEDKCLLPAYVWAVVFKKVALLLWIVVGGAIPRQAPFPFTAWMATFANSFASCLFQFTYAAVLYVLWAKSAGTRTVVRSIAFIISLSVVGGLLMVFNMGGDINTFITDINSAYNTTFSRWPSLTTGGIGPSGLTNAAPDLRTGTFYVETFMPWLFSSSG